MRKIFYVDLDMCGGENLPPDFELEDFCEVLQGKLPDVEVVAVTEENQQACNRDTHMVPDAIFNEALGEYCHR
jgi:hypothetical protein